MFGFFVQVTIALIETAEVNRFSNKTFQLYSNNIYKDGIIFILSQLSTRSDMTKNFI